MMSKLMEVREELINRMDAYDCRWDNLTEKMNVSDDAFDEYFDERKEVEEIIKDFDITIRKLNDTITALKYALDGLEEV